MRRCSSCNKLSPAVAGLVMTLAHPSGTPLCKYKVALCPTCIAKTMHDLRGLALRLHHARK